MDTVEFSIEYDGPELNEHVMDLQVLGPALMAINDLCREANRVLNGEDTMKVRVDMKATSEGCFNVTLQLTELAQGIASLLPPISAMEIGAALGLVGGGGGLLWLSKWQKGRKITKKIGGSGGDITVQIDGDNNQISISAGVDQLHQDPSVRKAQRQFVSPLDILGIEEIRLLGNGETVGVIQKKEVEAGYYDVRPEEIGQALPLSHPQVREAFLQLRAPVFTKGGKWQFLDGGRLIFVTIRDEAFLADVFKDGKKFGANDYLKVRLQITQNLLPDGKIQNDYEVEKVIEVISSMEQITLLIPEKKP